MKKQQTVPALSGVTMALAAAGLIAGCTAGGSAGSSAEAAPAAETVELAHYYGVNSCKDHNDCGTATNDCGGQASCKGTGFVATTAKSCGDVGGKVG